MKYPIKIISVFIFSSLVLSLVKASDVGTAPAAFLKLGVGARALGMGEAYSAVSSGVDGLYWNPARLVEEGGPDVMLTYKPLIQGSRYNQAAVSYSRESQAVGIGYSGLSYDPIDSFDEAGNPAGTYKASDQLFLLSYGNQLKNFSWGVTGKYIHSSIADVSASAMAGDVGVNIPNPWWRHLNHSLLVKNFGGTLTYLEAKETLPRSFIFGNAITWKRIIVGLDVRSVKGSGASGSVGVEIHPLSGNADIICLRSGYNTAQNKAGGLSGAAFGVGLQIKSLSFDFAWVPYGDLGSTEALTLKWKIPAFDFSGSHSTLRKSMDGHRTYKLDKSDQ